MPGRPQHGQVVGANDAVAADPVDERRVAHLEPDGIAVHALKAYGTAACASPSVSTLGDEQRLFWMPMALGLGLIATGLAMRRRGISLT